MKLMFSSFDYVYNWTVKDASGNVLKTFSTNLRQYVDVDFGTDIPRRVEAHSPSGDNTWMEIAASDGLIVGIVGGMGQPVQISTAAPA